MVCRQASRHGTVPVKTEKTGEIIVQKPDPSFFSGLLLVLPLANSIETKSQSFREFGRVEKVQMAP